MNTISSLLKGNPYPGRGILVGTIRERAVIAYFLMGRSENSRNRVVREEGDTLRIDLCDDGKATSTKLILYTPVRVCNGSIIVTNGDQTETICESLLGGHSFQYALSTRGYEPDAPNYTPRISAMVLPTGRYTIGMLRKSSRSVDCVRKYWSYDAQEGIGRLIHTYESDGDPLPTFVGEPRELALSGEPEELANELWSALDADNRISLYVRYTDLANGRFESAMRNKQFGD